MDSDPFEWLVRAKAGTNRLEIRTISPDLLMAVHARLRGRNAGGRGCFHGGVAVAAVEAIIARVMLVTKLDRLLALDPLSGIPG